MALQGIPISDDQCIGDSLVTINNAFVSLDASVVALTAAGTTSISGLSSTVDAKFIPKPASASAQQVLTYDSSTTTWVASAAPTGGGGSVTNVTGTAPISVATGTSTPVISIAAATTSSAGSMSAADKLKLDNLSSTSGITGEGSTTLSNGLIIKWGAKTNPGTTSSSVTYPVAFPNNAFIVVAGTKAADGDTGGGDVCAAVNSFSKTGFAVSHRSTSNWGYYWIALGN